MYNNINLNDSLKSNKYDRIIIGAGIYGLYAAIKSAKLGYKTLVLEMDDKAVSRGTYVNQARLHSGYHYPRSKATAQKSRDYFFRFMNDFEEAINTDFKQLYAISSNDSKTSKNEFIKFCDDLDIKCDEVDSSQYFKNGTVDGLFDTLEYAIDNDTVRNILLNRASQYNNLEIKYKSPVVDIKKFANFFEITSSHIDNSSTTYSKYITDYVLNATYANTNEILKMLDYDPLDIKYELCEVLLCSVSDNLKNVGLTVMDGPFFSIMPFGKTGLHSLTSVTFTPHTTSYDQTPTFSCQNLSKTCNPNCTENCNSCVYRPKSAWNRMYNLARKYLNDDICIEYVDSLITLKPILNSCEKDDARPTLVKTYCTNPTFITVFSGKLNTIYDLDDVL